MPLRCSAAGFGIGEERQARCVAGQKNQEGEVVACDRQNGGEGARGIHGYTWPIQCGTSARADEAVHSNDACNSIGARPQRAGANSNKHAPLISAWSAIVHSDIGPGSMDSGSVCPLPIASILDHSSPHFGLSTAHVDRPLDCYLHAPCREWYCRLSLGRTLFVGGHI